MAENKYEALAVLAEEMDCVTNNIGEVAIRLVQALKDKNKEAFQMHMGAYNIRFDAFINEYKYEIMKLNRFSILLNEEGRNLGYITEQPKQEPQAEAKAEQPKENPLAIQKTRPEGKQTKKAKK